MAGVGMPDQSKRDEQLKALIKQSVLEALAEYDQRMNDAFRKEMAELQMLCGPMGRMDS
jgi:hypothetical protein